MTPTLEDQVTYPELPRHIIEAMADMCSAPTSGAWKVKWYAVVQSLREWAAQQERVTPEVLADFWVREFVDAKVGLCALCANTGSIITNAVSAAGVRTNYNGPCICPNGRALSAPPTRKEQPNG